MILFAAVGQSRRVSVHATLRDRRAAVAKKTVAAYSVIVSVPSVAIMALCRKRGRIANAANAKLILTEEVHAGRALVARIGRFLFDRHLTDAGGGNISLRVGDVFCMSPTLAGQTNNGNWSKARSRDWWSAGAARSSAATAA